MTRFLRDCVFGAGVAALLAGCAGSVGSSLAPQLQSLHAGRPWTLRGTKNTALLYIANADAYSVSIYSDPAWQPVGELLSFSQPWHLCVDAAQDVYVVDLGARRIAEYAHGGVTPIRTFDDSQGEPDACAVNPITGDLAVADSNGPNNSPGDVLVYHSAKRAPKKYIALGFTFYFRLAYDPKGNLVVDGSDKYIYQSYLAELPAGGRAFETLSLDQNIAFGDLAWDGRFMTVAYSAGYSTFIYRLVFSGSNVIVKDSTFLSDAQLNGVCFEMSHSKNPKAIAVIGADARAGTVGEWSYPAGGAATKSIGGFDEPLGVAVSQ